MATERPDIKTEIMRILESTTWITTREIHSKLSDCFTPIQTVRSVMSELKQYGTVVVRNEANLYRYCLFSKAGGDLLKKQNILLKEGLPWIKFPRTKEGAEVIIQHLTHVVCEMMPEGETMDFFQTTIDHIQGMIDRVLP